MNEMTSNQPYLLRAFYDWIVDNGCTPYIVVDADREGVEVPREFVQNGQIVLNISPSACVNLHMSLEIISFQARFGGVPRMLTVPCNTVTAIYARENGAGTVFTSEKETPPPNPDKTTKPDTEKRPQGKPSLKVIK